MELEIELAGGAKVNALFKGFTVKTDQPPQDGGEGSAPSPFEVFLASLGTCAGYYVVSYCQKHGLSTEGIRLLETVRRNPETHKLDKIDIEIKVPPSFPEKYYDALVRAAEQCAVKKVLESPPAMDVFTTVVAP